MWNNKRLAKLLGQLLFMHIQKLRFNANFMALHATKLPIVLLLLVVGHNSDGISALGISTCDFSISNINLILQYFSDSCNTLWNSISEISSSCIACKIKWYYVNDTIQITLGKQSN